MTTGVPVGIQLHLTTGREHLFFQSDTEVVASICADLDGPIFSRGSLIVSGEDEVTAFPGHAIIGITIITDPLPEFFLIRERQRGAVVGQISAEMYRLRRLQGLAKHEGHRSTVLSEIEFTSGQRLFLEFSEIAGNTLGERNAMNHLFTRPSLFSRSLGGGLSVWNTAHIVSWSHHPRFEVPANAWPTESPSAASNGEATIARML